MTHPKTSNRPHPAGRRPAGFLVLVLAIGLTGVSQSVAERFPEDPVEKFRRALTTESDYYRQSLQSRLSLAKDAAARKELEATLRNVLAAHEKRMTDAEKGLTNLSDLSRALFLLEWPLGGSTDRIDPEADQWQVIDDKVRTRMKNRLVDETIMGLKDGTPDKQIALCNLAAENVVNAEDPSQFVNATMIDDLAKLVDPLKRLLKNSTNENVRSAVALALGRYVRQADKVAPAFKQVLADPKDYGEKSRRAAAEGLVSLVQHLTGEDVLRASEPGVTPRETQRSRLKPLPKQAKDKNREERTSYRNTLGLVAAAVTPASTEGARDSSAVVRRTCLSALRQSAGAAAYEIRLMKDEARQLIDKYNTDYTKSARDRDREWTEWEKAQATEERKDLEAGLDGVRPALQAFTNKDVLRALQRALQDSDTGIRLEARRTLDELSRLRRYLIEYDNQIPAQGKIPGKIPAKKTSGGARGDGTIIRVSGIEAPSVSRTTSMLLLRRQRKEADALGDLLLELGNSIIRGGTFDPNPKGRLATVEAVEALGSAAVPFIPRLVLVLSDTDLFVRWVAARTLEKLAYTVEKEAPEKSAMIVAGLVSMLEDDDLDPRTAAATALGAYGPAAKSAVGPLAGKLAKGDTDFRVAVIKALEGIGTDSAPALPVLVKLFADPDQRIRAEAVRVVGRFGGLAKKYLPQMERLIDDLDLEVRKAATASVLQVTRAR